MTTLERDIRSGILGLGDIPFVDAGGGVAAEVGGSRNYHFTGGATGGDLGNRPE